ncbi:putative zinc finger protein 66 isoform X2 [Daktulosphaira vitifoliae]|uniref:putative zinc finger protein 66 isoform X2 n=1 Tax=Daktulosphaira vitifoliae TaxID=58002 RepID=UPI0021AA22D0|nr:putative zinc finger protein 66 isoform X2 [Daktulosphaira vitifoliae]
MAEVDSRYIAFENDHTYLKTTNNCEVNSTQISDINSPPFINVSDDKIKSYKKVVDGSQFSISQAINMLSGPNSKIFFLPAAVPTNSSVPSFVFSPGNNICSSTPNEKKSTEKCILPKIPNSVGLTQVKNSKILFIPSTASSLNLGIQNILKPIPSKLLIPKTNEPIIHSTQNKKENKDTNKGVRRIKLSSNSIKRIQNGEKLFMCLDCDKIYFDHNKLLDHQKTHKQLEQVDIMEIKKKKLISQKKQPTDRKEKENSDDCNIEYEFSDTLFCNSPVNIKKQKSVFKGECIMCHSIFPDLGKHIQTFHQNDLEKSSSFQCLKCELKFDIEEHLQVHELSMHKYSNIYTCEHCFKDFSFKKDLEIHMESHNVYNNMKYLCPYCDAGFSQSIGLRSHLKKHIGNNIEKPVFFTSSNQVENSPTRPEHLDQLFAELDNISDNVNGVVVEQVTSNNYCVRFVDNESDNYKIQKPELLDQSIKNEVDLTELPLPNKDYENKDQSTNSSRKRVSYTVCRICLVIVSYSRIGRHMRKKHNNAAPYQCEICHTDFNRKHLMDDHRRKHTNNKPHKCFECNKCFAYKHHRNRHMMIVHNADTLDKPFKCPMCDKAFSFKEYLTLHVNSRHKGKRYMCQICGKSFPTNAGLNKHQLCHTDERPFMCEQCGRTFKCKTHCDTHKKNMHPGDSQLSTLPEKFECELCNKTFTTKMYRDMHFKRHNGQGHQCSICFKLFVSKAHLQRHIKLMH